MPRKSSRSFFPLSGPPGRIVQRKNVSLPVNGKANGEIFLFTHQSKIRVTCRICILYHTPTQVGMLWHRQPQIPACMFLTLPGQILVRFFQRQCKELTSQNSTRKSELAWNENATWNLYSSLIFIFPVIWTDISMNFPEGNIPSLSAFALRSSKGLLISLLLLWYRATFLMKDHKIILQRLPFQRNDWHRQDWSQ